MLITARRLSVRMAGDCLLVGPSTPECARGGRGGQVIALRDSLADRTEAPGWVQGAACLAKQPRAVDP